jgi:hypothetical protein
MGDDIESREVAEQTSGRRQREPLSPIAADEKNPSLNGTSLLQ